MGASVFRPGLQDPHIEVPLDDSDKISEGDIQDITGADSNKDRSTAATMLNESGQSQRSTPETTDGNQEEPPHVSTVLRTSAPTTSRKRSASTTPPSTQPGSKQSHHKRPRRKESNFADEFASGFRILAESLTTSGGGPSSPERRTAAIKALQDDTQNEMSEDEQVKAVRIIQRNTAVADSYLALEKKSMRLRLIHAELDDLY